MEDDELTPHSEVIAPESSLEQDRDPPVRSHGRDIRTIVWAIAVVVFGAWVVFGKVHTYLGVKAFSWDKEGREHVWRVWWRARDNIIERDSTAFVAVYVGLIVMFALFSALALWIALAPDDQVEIRSTLLPDQ